MELFIFFLQVPPPFEKIALLELKKKQVLFFSNQALVAKVVPGGIEISTSLEIGFFLNKILRIPNRILLVLAEFKCRDVPKLYNKISKLEWTSYINSSNITVVSSSKDSRLFDSRKIEKAIKDGIDLSFKAKQLKKKYTTPAYTPKRNHHIFVKILNDLCTISIDTSGERLGLSGYKSLINAAPIRENLAAALIFTLKQSFPEAKNITDPMCGSGTFLIEAARFFEINDKREFQFSFFPLSDKLKKIDTPKSSLPLYNGVGGFDLKKETVQMTEKNLLKKWNIKLEANDFFKLESSAISPDSLMILNPPYGKRLAIDEARRSFFEKLITKLAQFKNLSGIGLIIPEDIIKSLNKTLTHSFKVSESLKFKNGGYPVRFMILEPLATL